MATAGLEHVNITVSDPDRTAGMLCELFGWKVRWSGDAIHNGRTVHVGSETGYIAVYSKGQAPAELPESYGTRGGLNHIGIVVDDLDAVEQKVIDAGFTPHLHGDYEPGRRFYFDDADGIEFEVVSYSP
ncbi:MAG: VOC family protein [Pseudomonadota bacterium]